MPISILEKGGITFNINIVLFLNERVLFETNLGLRKSIENDKKKKDTNNKMRYKNIIVIKSLHIMVKRKNE